jgi:hypothetical protein
MVHSQDLPAVEIPLVECSAPPVKRDNIKYLTGEPTTTYINLLDWNEANGPSPLATSKGWVDVNANDFVDVNPDLSGAFPVTTNGLPMTEDFDLAVYIKGDKKPTVVYRAWLEIDYEDFTTFCDFDDLTVYPDSAEEGKVADGTVNGEALHSSCGMTVTPSTVTTSTVTLFDTTASFITVLDSESPVRDTTNTGYDSDLGSPNKSCGGVGRGSGGKKGKRWENCKPLGNVLILQNSRYSYPNDSRRSGCMTFRFDEPATNVALGLLDIDFTETAKITVCCPITKFTSSCSPFLFPPLVWFL